jgi:hypothetical protein
LSANIICFLARKTYYYQPSCQYLIYHYQSNLRKNRLLQNQQVYWHHHCYFHNPRNARQESEWNLQISQNERSCFPLLFEYDPPFLSLDLDLSTSRL